jgi:TonB family protein
MSFLQNILTAEWILNTAVHSLSILIMGWLLLRVFKQKNPPLRSAIVQTTMLILVLLLLISFSSSPLEYTKFSLGIIPSSHFAQDASSAIETELSTDYASAPIKTGILSRLLGTGPFVIKVINLFGILWVIGTALFIFRFLYSAASLWRLKKNRLEIYDPRTKHIFSEAEKAFPRPVRAQIFESAKVKVPMVIGFFSPYILIPRHLFKRLKESEIRGVFLHELSHIYHRDHMTAILQRIVTILNWWNPLAHTLSTDLSRAREEISDNHVLLRNNSKEYAECLVNLAERNTVLSRLPVSVAMASSHIPLKERVKHILSKERKMETQLKRSTVWVIILAAFLCLGLVSGYRLTFATNQGSEQPESVRAENPIPPEMVQEKKEQEKKEKPPVRAEGDIKPPKLIKKIDPVYPEEARKEGIEGVVILEATADSYGRVQKVKVLRPVAELNQAAIDAVKQWVYEPMIIDGEPVGVIFTVTCRFKLKDKEDAIRAVGEIKPP